MTKNDFSLSCCNQPINLKAKLLSIRVHRINSGINFTAMDNALANLSSGANALRSLFCRHSTKTFWNFNQKTLLEKTPLDTPALNSAIMELLLKGYLTVCADEDDSGNTQHFDFWEDPDMIKTTAAA